MHKFDIGSIVKATSGRENGELFVIKQIDSCNAMLVNGKTRKLEKPKRKNLKHIYLLLKQTELKSTDKCFSLKKPPPQPTSNTIPSVSARPLNEHGYIFLPIVRHAPKTKRTAKQKSLLSNSTGRPFVA